MDLLFIPLLICFFFFLYVVYELCRDDFVILRKNIPMEKIFNAAFMVAISGLVVSRLFYVLSHPSTSFLNPLVFLIFPYYPGLSLIGGIIGGIISSIAVSKNWGMPTGRILDFFTMAFVSVFPLGFLLATLTSHQRLGFTTFILLLVYVLFFVVIWNFLLPKTMGAKLKDGSLSSISVTLFSLIYILSNVLVNSKNILNLENVFALLLFIVSLAFLIQHEGVEKLVFRR